MDIRERTKQRRAAGLIPKYNHKRLPFGLSRENKDTPQTKIPLPVFEVCEYEGPVVESCKTCNNGQRDVRMCLHPNPSDPDRDTCTRGYVSDKIQACINCPDRKVKKSETTITGWKGAGWYCVSINNHSCKSVELLEEDMYDSTITICSGPYSEQHEALTHCNVLYE